jgi:hypothetical protein
MRRALVVALALLVPAVATAQPTGEKKEDAQSLMESGVKLLAAKDYLGALAIFKTAYERFPSTKILLNIGTTLKLLGRDADAANAYQRYLDAKDTDPKRQAELDKLLAKIDKTASRVEIEATPADAQLHVDDDDWLNVVHGSVWRVMPGRHTVTARRDGYEAKTKAIQVAAGETASISLDLVAVTAPTPTVVTTPAPVSEGEGVGAGVGVHATVTPTPRRSPLGALVFGEFDLGTFDGLDGGAALVGATYDVHRWVVARAAAIISDHHFGGYVGAVVPILVHQYRPYVSAGMPILGSNGPRYAIRGAGGFEYELNVHLAFAIEAGVEHLFNPQMGVKATAFVPGVGVIGRL